MSPENLEIRRAEEPGSGFRNSEHYTRLYTNGFVPIFEEGDIFRTIIPVMVRSKLTIDPAIDPAIDNTIDDAINGSFNEATPETKYKLSILLKAIINDERIMHNVPHCHAIIGPLLWELLLWAPLSSSLAQKRYLFRTYTVHDGLYTGAYHLRIDEHGVRDYRLYSTAEGLSSNDITPITDILKLTDNTMAYTDTSSVLAGDRRSAVILMRT